MTKDRSAFRTLDDVHRARHPEARAKRAPKERDMAYEQILTDISDNILTITLNRPDKLNAFTQTMMNEMIDAFRKANEADDVRAIVVTGAGRAFCAGADLSAGARTFDATRRADRPERNAGPAETVNWSDERV